MVNPMTFWAAQVHSSDLPQESNKNHRMSGRLWDTASYARQRLLVSVANLLIDTGSKLRQYDRN